MNMIKTLFEKGRTFFVIVMFIGMTTQSLSGYILIEKSSITPFKGHVLYVGGSGSGNYSNIQDAINNASKGDTVFVYNGTYFENLVVDKSINLIGEDKSNTVIDGNGTGTVVYISSDNVTTTGFTISNCGNDVYDAGLYIDSETNILSGNIITYNKWYSVYLENSSSNYIFENNIINSDHCGIYLNNTCNYNIIYGNNITNHKSYCVYLSYLSNHNIIYENTVINDKPGFNIVGAFNIINNNSFKGEANIVLFKSYQNTVINNIFDHGGIYIEGDMLVHWNSHIIENNILDGRCIKYYKNVGSIEVSPDMGQLILANCNNFTIQNLDLADSCSSIQLGFSRNNLILNNSIHNNKYNGIGLHISYNNTLCGNTLTNIDGVAILLVDSFFNTVSENSAKYNLVGISLYSYLVNSSCTNNVISDNVVTSNYGTGVVLSNVNHNTISGNYLIKNSHAGIHLDLSCNNTIIDNNISETTTGYFQAGIFLCDSNDNLIAGNTITRNNIGISLDGNDNVIIENIFENNTNLGISMHLKSANNCIYHNNFINNIAVNKGNNMWDDGYRMGNYWLPWYGGSDDDGDGIGDIPFDIPGTGNAQDRYPLMFPYGKKTGVKITTPQEGFIYVRNFKILPFFYTVVLGNIKIKVNAANYMYGIDHVEFLVDNIKRGNDTTPPYSWRWRFSSPIQHRHIIKVIAFAKTGEKVSDNVLVWRFF